MVFAIVRLKSRFKRLVNTTPSVVGYFTKDVWWPSKAVFKAIPDYVQFVRYDLPNVYLLRSGSGPYFVRKGRQGQWLSGSIVGEVN